MPTNAEIQQVRSLREKKHRAAAGLFVVEGEKVVAELLAAQYPFAQIYATAAWPGECTRRVTPAQMARLSHFPTASAVLAVGRIRREALPEGALDQGLTLALDGVQDPGNVGTLLRIADWYGLDRVVLAENCADLYSPKVVQASMGSFARLPVHVAGPGGGAGLGPGARPRLRSGRRGCPRPRAPAGRGDRDRQRGPGTFSGGPRTGQPPDHHPALRPGRILERRGRGGGGLRQSAAQSLTRLGHFSLPERRDPPEPAVSTVPPRTPIAKTAK